MDSSSVDGGVYSSVYGLVTGHVGSEQQLAQTLELLQSVGQQIIPAKHVFCSLSYGGSADQVQKWRTTIYQLLKTLSCPITLYEAASRLSQFEHYHKLRLKLDLLLKPTPNSFLIFSNSSDFWHPQRVELSLAAIQQLLDSSTMDKYAVIRIQEEGSFDIRAGGEYVPKREAEHQDFVVRWFMFADFMDALTPQQRKHQLCDVLFCRFLSAPRGRTLAVPISQTLYQQSKDSTPPRNFDSLMLRAFETFLIHSFFHGKHHLKSWLEFVVDTMTPPTQAQKEFWKQLASNTYKQQLPHSVFSPKQLIQFRKRLGHYPIWH